MLKPVLLVKLFFIFCFFLLLLGCSVSSNSTYNNYSYLYSRGSIINPEFKIYHTNNDTSEIIFKIESADLIYSRPSPEFPYQSKFKISYSLYEDLNSRHIVDSLTTHFVDVNPTKKHKLIYGRMKFPYEVGRSGTIKITTFDQQRNQEHKTINNIRKSSLSSAQNFLAIENNRKMTRPFITSDDSIKILSDRNAGRPFYLKCFNDEFGIARPPFSSSDILDFDLIPNNTYEVNLSAFGQASILLPNDGLVLIQADSSKAEGLTLFRFDKNYPKIANATGLAEPLRYICSNDEYKSLTESDNQKLAVEQFWIEKCQSKDRAREIIQEYYTRVNEANTYFTSYIEGWKTDRGMIAIIYGKPLNIEKRNDYEVWKYGQGSSYQTPSLSFTFYKRQNPFTDNDYTLKREYFFKPGWYRALDIWRAGRIYKAGI